MWLDWAGELHQQTEKLEQGLKKGEAAGDELLQNKGREEEGYDERTVGCICDGEFL